MAELIENKGAAAKKAAKSQVVSALQAPADKLATANLGLEKLELSAKVRPEKP